MWPIDTWKKRDSEDAEDWSDTAIANQIDIKQRRTETLHGAL